MTTLRKRFNFGQLLVNDDLQFKVWYSIGKIVIFSSGDNLLQKSHPVFFFFSAENRTNIINLSTAELCQRLIKVK